ncbi:hypothetical protein OHB24_21340 [Kribbella sp. NBC_00482]|uniref:hypothetical protein n=1 Tax=Kribbella sp. NBC_00482 TaxID=2975968 RepID=UPI002E19DE46
MTRWQRFLNRTMPWRRGYSRGWDDGLETALLDLRMVLREQSGDVIPRAEVVAFAARLQAELDPSVPHGPAIAAINYGVK